MNRSGPTATAPTCPRCGLAAQLVDDAVVYGRSYGRVWLCPNYGHGCDCRVGAHADGRPKGSLADAETRQARMDAHSAFDPAWRKGPWRGRRELAYRWLAKKLGLPRDECHVGLFDVAMCRRVVEVCRKWRV